jgi:hypothetical protein
LVCFASLIVKTIRHWWESAMLGGIIGLPVGVCLELARKHFADAVEQAAEYERRVGSSPPLPIDLLHPWVVPILTMIVFATVAVLVNKILSSEHS